MHRRISLPPRVIISFIVFMEFPCSLFFGTPFAHLPLLSHSIDDFSSAAASDGSRKLDLRCAESGISFRTLCRQVHYSVAERSEQGCAAAPKMKNRSRECVTSERHRNFRDRNARSRLPSAEAMHNNRTDIFNSIQFRRPLRPTESIQSLRY